MALFKGIEGIGETLAEKKKEPLVPRSRPPEAAMLKELIFKDYEKYKAAGGDPEEIKLKYAAELRQCENYDQTGQWDKLIPLATQVHASMKKDVEAQERKQSLTETSVGPVPNYVWIVVGVGVVAAIGAAMMMRKK